MLHLAVDVGGTFTDICLFDDQEGATRVAKVSSTRDPIDAVFEGIGEMGVALGEISLFSHGTTVATNALITREFPRAAMVTTRGFRDVIEIRRGTKQDLWDAYEDVAPPYVRRRDRFEVPERVDYAGEDVPDGCVTPEGAKRDYGVVVRELDAELAEWEVDEGATEQERTSIRNDRIGWLDEDPAELARRHREGKIGTFELIRRHGVILDWGTGELLPKTTAGFRAML